MVLRYAINKESLTSLGTLTQQFKILYESEFPDIHEREDFDVILKRITDLVTERKPNSFIVLAVEQNDLLLGGLIGDWYSNCNSIHLTYIAVEKSARRNKVASTLIEKGIDIIKDFLSSKHDLKINQVFFEANIPNKTFEDSFDPVVRLEFFRKLGAKWIDIPYTQPALDKTKKSVKNLYLLVFPGNAQGNGRINKSDLQNFLENLYSGLGIENPSEDIDFIAMLSKINNTKELREMNLKEIPRHEKSKYQFKKAAVTMHFVEDDDPSFGGISISDDNLFLSFEADLLSYHFQNNPPFSTFLVSNIQENEIIIEFPEKYNYKSEGRLETNISEKKSINARFSLSVTIFNRPRNHRIWNLTIVPKMDIYFTEYKRYGHSVISLKMME